MKAQIIYNLPVAVTVEIDDDEKVTGIDNVIELGDLIAYDETQPVVIRREDGTELAMRGDSSEARRISEQADLWEWPVRR